MTRPVKNISSSQRITRRQMLGKSAAALAFTIVPRHVLGGRGYTPPSEQITKGIIGVGGMGKNHIGYAGTRVLAVCDADANHLNEAVEKAGPDCKDYRDFRELLARPDIDIVHIATPPHWHALMSIAAAEAGKDIWCEKPMTRTIGEGISVVDAVRRHGCVFRVNTWFRFRGKYYGLEQPTAKLKKLVLSDRLGWPLKVTLSPHVGINWKQGEWSGQTYLKPEEVPPELDYDMWLGPAPYKPYNPERVHAGFRGYWDYDGGGLGDMGQHYLDPIQYVLGKDDESPVEIIPDTQQQHPDAVLPWRRVVMRYADGCEIVLESSGDAEAPLLQGPGGWVGKKFKSDIPNLLRWVDTLPAPEPQVTDFLTSVRTRRTFALNEMNGHRSTTLINLAKTAARLGRPLRFDSETQRFVGDNEANRMVYQPMRGPWTLEGAFS